MPNPQSNGDPLAVSEQTERVCVLVLGMHRSGTSAMTRTINAMGAALPGNLIPPLEDNAEGFWESADIVGIHNRFMVTVGSAWNDPRALDPAVFASAAAATCRDDLMRVLRRDFEDKRLFVIKDPRISVLMPMWRQLLGDFGAQPYVVLGFRHPEEVALSLVKRRDGFVDAANLPVAGHAHATWLIHSLDAERQTRDLPRVVISYDDFLNDPVGAAQTLADRLGCFEARQVAAGLAFARTQWKAGMRNHAETVGGELLPAWVDQMYRWLVRAAAGEEPPTEELDALGHVMNEAFAVYGPLIGAGLPSPQVYKRPVLTRIARRVSRLSR
jgi:hypothetical protein